MRSCVAYFLLLLLLATNGYAIWQVRCLRAEITALRHRLETPRSPEPESAADIARAALAAIRSGRVREARRELERLEGQIESMSHLASQRRANLQAQIIQARQALAGKSGEAAPRIERLLRELSHRAPEEAAGE